MARLKANTVLTKPGTFEPVALFAGDEVPDWADDMVGDHLIDHGEPPRQVAQEEAGKSDDPDGSWTVAELKDYARANDVDLHGATSKSDILAAIQG